MTITHISLVRRKPCNRDGHGDSRDEQTHGPQRIEDRIVVIHGCHSHSSQEQASDQYQKDRRQEDERVLEHETQGVALKIKPFHDGHLHDTEIYAS